nr:phosphatidylinositol 4,5-bisphosphate-binding protein slm1 [Quercus suber]
MSNQYGSVPAPSDVHYTRGYGTSGVNDFATGAQSQVSPISQSAQQPTAFPDYAESSVGGDHGDAAGVNRTASTASTAVHASTPSRSNTLRKKASVRRTGSLKRSNSRKSLAAGSIKGVTTAEHGKDFNSAFSTPIPTQGAPTEILANRFQAWRQLLKSLITYFREIQNSYEQRAKAVHKVQNTISNIVHPAVFSSENGLGEATRILDDYHKRSIAESNKSREIENDVIGALTGLRSDLGQKIKEIKSLSGDFKNSVDKEKESTRREVEKLQEALQHADHEDGMATGKSDPFVVRLGVDRAIEKQVDEENYLHRAYLNLESSGRELEAIVVGEIQKAYNALAGIIKREGDDAYHAVEALRTGPISMPKDHEWQDFVVNDPHFVDPNIPLRRIEDIDYPGKNHPAATEVRSGMLERKSKYLKSYTPGWYVLSPTHLHEFKSADKIYFQPPVMSLYLLDQKLGSKSEPGSSSQKFMLKGRQSGSMHKGHNWVFRAETQDTMEAWFEDIRILTEETGEKRDAFVRKHARSVSGTSDGATISSDGMEEDEADAVPYSADAASLAEQNPQQQQRPSRPQPGRFPSDLKMQTAGPMSPVSDDSDNETVAAAAVLPGSLQHEYAPQNNEDPYRLPGVPSRVQTQALSSEADTGYNGANANAGLGQQKDLVTEPVQTQTYNLPVGAQQPVNQQQPFTTTQQSLLGDQPAATSQPPIRHDSSYGDWLAPTAAGVAGVGAGALGAEAYRRHQQEQDDTSRPLQQPDTAIPTTTPEGPTSGVTALDDGNKVLVAQPTGMPSTAVLPVASLPSTTTSADTAPPISEVLSPPSAATTAVRPEPFTFPSTTAQLPKSSTPIEPTPTLGGNEAEGAHETGHLFPRVVRHDTNLSVSKLHVPGEFPKQGSEERIGHAEVDVGRAFRLPPTSSLYILLLSKLGLGFLLLLLSTSIPCGLWGYGILLCTVPCPLYAGTRRSLRQDEIEVGYVRLKLTWVNLGRNQVRSDQDMGLVESNICYEHELVHLAGQTASIRAPWPWFYSVPTYIDESTTARCCANCKY